MTPESKANMLIEEIMEIQGIQYWQAKLCAILLCEKIIEVAPENKSIIGSNYLSIKDFYKEVKKEIETNYDMVKL